MIDEVEIVVVNLSSDEQDGEEDYDYDLDNRDGEEVLQSSEDSSVEFDDRVEILSKIHELFQVLSDDPQIMQQVIQMG